MTISSSGLMDGLAVQALGNAVATLQRQFSELPSRQERYEHDESLRQEIASLRAEMSNIHVLINGINVASEKERALAREREQLARDRYDFFLSKLERPKRPDADGFLLALQHLGPQIGTRTVADGTNEYGETVVHHEILPQKVDLP